MKSDLASVQNTFQDNKNKLAQQIQQLNKFVSEEIAAVNKSSLEVKEYNKKITSIVKAKYGQWAYNIIKRLILRLENNFQI